MHKLFISILLNLICFQSFSQAVFFSGGNICETEPWELVFSDEFELDSLDESKWITYFPYTYDGSDQCEFCRTHGTGGQIFLDSNVVVNSGTLKLIAKKQDAFWFNAARNYTSGMVHSRQTFMYGKYEIFCKIPYGEGFWPAFWMFGGNGTEIDVFEFGGQKPNYHHLGIKRWDDLKDPGYGYGYNGVDFSKDFHLFSVEWDPFFITFRVDGNEVDRISRYFTLSGDAVDWCCVKKGNYLLQPAFPSGYDNKVNVIANLGIGIQGGPFTDAPTVQTLLPNQFEIDFIRVYQRKKTAAPEVGCQLVVFPNPVENNIYVKKEGMSLIKIISQFGREVFVENIDSNEIAIRVSELPNGVYVVCVYSESGYQFVKFVKL